MSGDIFDQIDHALGDWTVSGDAMRWTPEPPMDRPPPATGPARPPASPYTQPPNWCHPEFADKATFIRAWLQGSGPYATRTHLVLAETEQVPLRWGEPAAIAGPAFKRVILRRRWICLDAALALRPEYYPAAIDQTDRVVATGLIGARRG